MPSDSHTSTDTHAVSSPNGIAFPRLAGVGLILLCVAGGFFYLGGWFSPHALTPARFTDEFEAGGVHSGFRRNHAKGLPVTGFFESNGQGARFSRAVVFNAGRVPVIGRFSLGGGDPNQADAFSTVRGLGLQFSLPDGEEWRTAMVNLPVFPFNTPQAFYEQMVASAPDPQTGKPDPKKMQEFAANNPEVVKALGILGSHPPSSGFDNSTFNSLNAFWFVDANGVKTPVHWSMVPVQPFVAASATGQGDKNYLFDALITAVQQHPLQWHLILTVGQPGDPTTDATIPWSDGREKVDAGTLTLDHVEAEESSVARDINFDPLVLPAGIKPTDDPLLSARSAIYSQSYTRRSAEKKEPSAITDADVRK
jgi:catalase